MSHYLAVDDLTKYERPVTGPLDTSLIFMLNGWVITFATQ